MTHLRNILRFLMRRVARNVTAKLMALAMAVALWVYAYTASYSAPVPIKGVHVRVAVRQAVAQGEDWAAELPPAHREATVTLSYPRRFESEVHQAVQNGDVCLELRPAPAGADEEQTFAIVLREDSEQCVFIAPARLGIKVHSFNPGELTLTLVQQARKQLDVRPDVIPPSDYSVAERKATPPTVRVRGRKSIVERAKEIATEPIDLSRLSLDAQTWSDRIEAPVAAHVKVDGRLHPVTAFTAQVVCEIRLEQFAQSREFDEVPINLLQPVPYGNIATLTSGRTAKVSISGRADLAREIRREDIKLFVDLSDLTKPGPEAVKRPIQYTLSGLGGQTGLVVRVEPPDCQVKVTERPPD